MRETLFVLLGSFCVTESFLYGWWICFERMSPAWRAAMVSLSLVYMAMGARILTEVLR